MEKPKSYILEIYEPDSTFCHSRSEQKKPFPNFSEGDDLQFDDTNELVKIKLVELHEWETEMIFTSQTLVWTTKK